MVGGVTPLPPVRTGTQATLSLLLLRVSHFKRYYLRFRFSHNFFFKNNANILLNSKLSTFINQKIGRCSFFKGILERLEKGYILISKILNMTKNISNKCINAETVNCFFKIKPRSRDTRETRAKAREEKRETFFVPLPSRAISHARGHLRVSRFA